MAKIHIVDENDIVIGEKERAEITPEDTYRVSALWLTNSKGDVLLAQRPFTKKNSPGKWGPAISGTVEAGESYLDNVIKETWEEIGLQGVSPIEGPKTKQKNRNYFVQWFFLEKDVAISDLVVPPDEVIAVQWFPKEELKEEVRSNPEKFVGTMPVYAEMFLK